MACVIGIWVTVMEKGRDAMGIEQPSLQWAIRNLIADKERGVTQFFASRLKCSCLKEKSQRVKADPKLGHCDYCKEEKKRTELKVCSRCKIQHYAVRLASGLTGEKITKGNARSMESAAWARYSCKLREPTTSWQLAAETEATLMKLWSLSIESRANF
ncbi:hypothetical protein ACHAXT_012089 [Thalassiosira profunda]